MSEHEVIAPGEKPHLDPFEHVVNNKHIEIFDTIHLSIGLPQILGYQVTKFHILLALAAVVVSGLLIYLSRKMRSGEPPRGKFVNMIETFIFFIRDQVAKPGLGNEKDANKYTPFLVTMFLFVFLVNVFGMIPFLGSATADLQVTFALSLVCFGVIHVTGVREHGGVGYLKTFVPHLHVDNVILKWMLMIGMAVLEYATAFIRVTVLAVRLFANMLAGHTALFVLLFFIKMAAAPEWVAYIGAPDWSYYIVMPISVLLVTALSFLELFVAGLQAFVFTFLTAIFIGLAKHPAH